MGSVADVGLLPAGTVTFLLTDVEGSTSAWQERPAEMAVAIARHYEILAAAIEHRSGARPQEQGEGDSVVGAFSRASDAMAAALQTARDGRSGVSATDTERAAIPVREEQG